MPATLRYVFGLFLLIIIFGAFACEGTHINTGDGDKQDGDVNPDGDFQIDGDPDDTPPDGDKDDKADGDGEDDEEEISCTCVERCLDLNIVTNMIDFGSVAPNTCEEMTLEITSSGSKTINVYNVSLLAEGTSDEFFIDTATAYEPSVPPIALDPQHFLRVTIGYCPVDMRDDLGAVIIASDSDCSQRLDIGLQAGYKGNAHLKVEPPKIEWGEIVANGTKHHEEFTITAVPFPDDATRPLEVRTIILEPLATSMFEIQYQNNCLPPFFLRPNESRTCLATFVPVGEGPFVDTITIKATDLVTDEQTETIPLSGEGVVGSLTGDPEIVSFGYILVGEGQVMEIVSITNEGTGDIHIHAEEWDGNADGYFDVHETFRVFDAELPAGDSRDFGITFEPNDEGPFHGSLKVIYDRLGQRDGLVSIPVSAVAVDECPTGMQALPEDPARCVVSCDPGEYVCVYTIIGDDPNPQWGYAECQDDGESLGEVVACLAGQVCDTEAADGDSDIESDNPCVDVACNHGEFRCTEDHLHHQECVNGVWLEPEACELAEVDPDTQLPYICKVAECRTKVCNAFQAPLNSDCDDGNSCTVDEKCNQVGACKGDILDCDDDNPCTDDYSDPESVECCVYQNNNGNICTDGNVCTQGDHCDAGECVAGDDEDDCNDQNDCTDDSCTLEGGCVHTPNEDECDDGNVCTLGDVCGTIGQNAVCLSGSEEKDCDDGNECTRDFCQNPGGCQHTFQAIYCDDGNNCTLEDYCDTLQGVPTCVPGSEKYCNDNEDCTEDSCNEAGECEFNNFQDGSPCSDNNICTGEGQGADPDECINGECVAGDPTNCDDGNGCTTNWCDQQQGCMTLPNQNDCDDGNPCTVGDKCHDSSCQPGTGEKHCEDFNECTQNLCNPDIEDGCHFPPVGNTVECNADEDPCTVGDHCQDGSCTPGDGVPNCEDNNPCTEDTCDAVLGHPVSGCRHMGRDDWFCDDGNPCTVGDNCASNGTCQPGQGSNACNDDNPCTLDSCTDHVGCSNQDQTGGAGSCDDDNPCTEGDYCFNGDCTGGDAVSCEDYNDCTDNNCDPGQGCVFPSNDENSCSDLNPCSVGDYCEDGACIPGVGGAECDDGNPCTTDVCDADYPNGCRHDHRDGLPCDDDDICTLNDTCSGTQCQPGAPDSCDDDNPCTADSCDSDGEGCQNVNDDQLNCFLGDFCRTNYHCVAGECLSDQIDCSDNNTCTLDLCDVQHGGCYWENDNNALCDYDNSGCTVDDYCDGGTCQIGSEVDCSDLNDQCLTGICTSTSFDSYLCEEDSNPHEGLECNADDTACTDNDTCVEGVCTAGPELDCNDDLVCTTDSCHIVYGCQNEIQIGAECDDEMECTEVGVCQDDGQCLGADKPDGTPCTGGWCSNGQCIGTFDHPGPCPGLPDMMMVVGTTWCIDNYEASAWENSDCTGTRYGASGDNYPINDEGNGGAAIYACSIPGVIPSRDLTWFQAGKICQNTGKKLCAKSIWEHTCKGGDAGLDYPYGNSYNGETCNTNNSDVANTGHFGGCVSQFGVHDMSGNVWEWLQETSSAWRRYIAGGGYDDDGGDVDCSAGENTWRSDSSGDLGFRCCYEY